VLAGGTYIKRLQSLLELDRLRARQGSELASKRFGRQWTGSKVAGNLVARMATAQTTLKRGRPGDRYGDSDALAMAGATLRTMSESHDGTAAKADLANSSSTREQFGGQLQKAGIEQCINNQSVMV